MIKLRQEFELFLIALSFFTRIPVLCKIDYSAEKLNQANRYFGAVGLVVGLISAAAYCLSNLFLPDSLSAGIAILMGLWLTGAFHEDGLADVFDGFGGAWDPKRKLEIMKDSRIGTYGTLALVTIIGFKWFALQEVSHPAIALIVMHTISRVGAASIICALPYVQADKDSKVKPLANVQTLFDIKVLSLTAAVVLLLLLPLAYAVAVFLSALLIRRLCIIWFKRHLGGYTGDCLGAAQQLIEITGYLVLVALTVS